jgi:hypothetical protein
MLVMGSPQMSPMTGSDVETNADSKSIFDDFTTFQDEPSMDRSHLQTSYTSLSQPRLHSSIDKPLGNIDLRSLALPRPVVLNSFAPCPPAVAQPAFPARDGPHTSPQTMSSPNCPTAAGSHVKPIVPTPQHTPLTASPCNLTTSSPSQGHDDDALTPDPHEPNETDAEPRSPGRHHLALPITA